MCKRVLVIAIAATACGRSSPSTPDAVPVDAALDAAPFVMSGTIVDWTTAPIGNARVCLLDHPEVACTTTNDSGAWNLAIPFLPPPPTVEIATSVTADGYLGFLGLDYESQPGGVLYYSTIPLRDDARATTLLATQAGFSYPTTATGFIAVRVHGPVGTTASLSPASGTGPVYIKTDGTPDPQLTATQSTDAYVYFGNVAPGKYDVAASAPAMKCYDRVQVGSPDPVGGDWPPFGSGAIGVQVAGGAMTDAVNVYCF